MFSFWFSQTLVLLRDRGVSSNNTWSGISPFNQLFRYLAYFTNTHRSKRECVVIMFSHCLLQTVLTRPVRDFSSLWSTVLFLQRKRIRLYLLSSILAPLSQHVNVLWEWNKKDETGYFWCRFNLLLSSLFVLVSRLLCNFKDTWLDRLVL